MEKETSDYLSIIIWSWFIIGILSQIIYRRTKDKQITVIGFIKSLLIGLFAGYISFISLIFYLTDTFKWNFWNKKLF